MGPRSEGGGGRPEFDRTASEVWVSTNTDAAGTHFDTDPKFEVPADRAGPQHGSAWPAPDLVARLRPPSDAAGGFARGARM